MTEQRAGPFRVRLIFEDSELLSWLRSDHRPPVAGDPDLTICIRRTPGRVPGPLRPQVTLRGDVEHASMVGWRAEYHTKSRHCEVRISEYARPGLSGPAWVEAAVRVTVTRLAAQLGVLTFHAAAVTRDGEGVLFAGPSGAGKTTLATRWTWDSVLGDDCVLIERGRAGYRIYSTPWQGREKTPYSDGEAPLSAVCVLAHTSAAPRVESIGPGEAIRALVPQVVHPGHDASEAGRILDWLVELVERVPVCRLHFNLQDAVWPAVQRAVA